MTNRWTLRIFIKLSLFWSGKKHLFSGVLGSRFTVLICCLNHYGHLLLKVSVLSVSISNINYANMNAHRTTMLECNSPASSRVLYWPAQLSWPVSTWCFWSEMQNSIRVEEKLAIQWAVKYKCKYISYMTRTAATITTTSSART